MIKIINKIFALFIIIILLSNTISFAEVLENSEKVSIAEEVLFENFEGTVSPIFTPDSHFSIIDYEKNKVLRINATDTFTSTKTISSNLTDCMVEVDFKQVSSSSGLLSGHSIALRTMNFGQFSYRFIYADSIRFNPETYKLDNLETSRDSVLFGRSDNLHNMNNFYLSKMSDKPLGVLDNQNSTPWLKAKVIIFDGMMYCYYYNINGNKIFEMTAPLKDADWKGVLALGVSSIESGGVILAAQASDVYFDNFRISKLSTLKNIRFSMSSDFADTIQPLRFLADGTDVAGNNMDIKNNVSFICDDSIAIDKESGFMCFSKAGKFDITMKYVDPVFNKTIEETKTIDVVDKFNYESVELNLEKEATFKNSPVSYAVYGITDNGKKVELLEGYNISGDNATISNNKIICSNDGIHTITAKIDDVQNSVKLYVSKYEKLFFIPSKGKQMVGETISFRLSGLVNGTDNLVNDYKIEYDKNVFSIDKNNITFKQAWAHNINFIVDGENTSFMINVVEKEVGEILNENFENTVPTSSYVKYDEKDIVNNQLSLKNKSTLLWGDKSLSDYTVQARVKIINPMIEKNQFASSFEIVTRRGEKLIDGTDGSLGIPFCYMASDNYMRISSVKGHNVNISDGQWHDISVTNIGNQLIYKIDNVVQYHYGNISKSGYFQLRANNCEVLVDSVKMSKETNLAQKDLKNITSLVEEVKVNPYEVYDAFDFTAIKGFYGNSSNYITGDVKWEMVDGDDVAEFYLGQTIRFFENVKNGDRVTLKASYKGKECLIKLIVKLPELSKADYVRATTKIRRQSYIYLLTSGLDKRTVLNQNSLGAMAYIIAQMLLYPRMYDYSSLILWHVNQADYEETVVTRVMGGGDFVMLQMIAAYNELYGKIDASDASWDMLKKYLVETEYPDEEEWMSENHRMVYYAMALLVSEAWKDETMMEGRSTTQMKAIYTGYLKTWIDNRMRQGMGEHDSGYIMVDLFALEILYTYIKDPKVKKMTYDILTYLYADTLNDSLDSNQAGANMRMYITKGKDNIQKFSAFDILFNNGTEVLNEKYLFSLQSANLLISQYVAPNILYDFALDKSKVYENYERKGVYRIPDDNLVTETLEKYTYVTPEYALGCQIHLDTSTKYLANKGVYMSGTWKDGTSILPGHQELPWTLRIAKGKSTMIFDSHPGAGGVADKSGVHGYFAGDFQCLDYKYHQYKNTSIGMHKITLPNELKFTHFWVPKDSFDEMNEEDGWIFLRFMNTYVALKPLKDGKILGKQYEWGDPKVTFVDIPLSDVEVKINSANTAFVCEVYNTDEFKGDFSEFKQAIKENEQKNPIKYSINDKYFIEYTNIMGKTLAIDYNQNKRFTDGLDIDFTKSPLHNSPYMKSDWNSGNISLFYNNDTYKISSPKNTDHSEGDLIKIREFKISMSLYSGDKFAKLFSENIDDITTILNKYIGTNSAYISSVFENERMELTKIINSKKKYLSSLQLKKLDGGLYDK